MICPKCKSQLPAGAISCSKCGTKFKTKACPYCKSQILFSSTSCPRCGKRLVQSAAPAAQYAAANPPSAKGGFRWWYILVCVGIFILGAGVGAFGMRQSILNNVKSAFSEALNSSKPSSSSQLANGPSENGTDSTSSDTSVPQSSDSGKLGDFEISILEARKSTDYEGKPALIIGYKFTNNSAENKSFAVAVRSKAYQNSVQLESAILAGSDETYNSQNYMKEVQPGGTLDVELAYLLQDETNEVTVEVSELISLSKEKLTKKFPLT